MSAQMIELEEVKAMKISDDILEQSSGVEELGGSDYNSTGLFYDYC